MKQALFTITFLLMFSSIFAQKEVFFSDTSRDSISISKLEGIQFGVSFLPTYTTPIIEFGYFRELKLSKTISLTVKGSLENIIYKRNHYKVYISALMDSVVGDEKTDTKSDFQFSLSLEPRWYFNYVKRHLNGVKTDLNSGWFLGMPVKFRSSIFSPQNFFIPQTGYNDLFSPSISVTLLNNEVTVSPQVGYRYALSKKLFIETSVKYSLHIHPVTNIRGFENINFPYLNLNVSYCF